MKKENTKPVKVGKFTISSHAQNRIVEHDIIIISKRGKTPFAS
jgi:hypothetical protein